MEQRPVYNGTMDMLPGDVSVTPFLKSRRISDWSLESFLRNTTLDVDVFLVALRLLASYKKLDGSVRTFALQLRRHYSGAMGARRVKIIKQKLACEMNRSVLSGQEHLINQSNLEKHLDRQLSTTSSSDQLASSLTSSIPEINFSFTWRTELEHDLGAGTNIPTAGDEGGKTLGALSSIEGDLKDKNHKEDESREDLNTSGVAASVSAISSNNPKKRARVTSYTTEDPWHSILSLSKIIHGEKDVTFSAALPCMSSKHTHLFDHAVDSLKKYQAQEVNRNVTLLKDAQVAMSRVLNTMSANAQEYFANTQHQELLGQACSLSVIEGFDNHPSAAIAQEYEDCLAKRGVDGLKKQLIVDRGILNNKYMDYNGLPQEVDMRDKVLEILTILCKFVLRSPFATESPSENDCLHIWTSVFDVILDKVSLHTGEIMLKASKLMRHIQSLEHGDVSDADRKVNCIFMHQGIELSNIEFKRADIGDTNPAIQNRKNVRLARCIQEVHASLGVEDPSIFMADVHGFVGVFYQVRPMGDIAIAGKTTSDLVHLPRTAGGLKAFLRGNSLAIIWNFLTCLEAQGPIVQDAKELYEVDHDKAKFIGAIYRNLASTPSPV